MILSSLSSLFTKHEIVRNFSWTVNYLNKKYITVDLYQKNGNFVGSTHFPGFFHFWIFKPQPRRRLSRKNKNEELKRKFDLFLTIEFYGNCLHFEDTVNKFLMS